MEWFIFAFGAAILVSGAALVQKKTLLKEHALEYSAILALTNFLFSLLFIPKANFDIGLLNYGILYAGSWLGAVAFLFVSKAVRHMEVSAASPLLNFGPAITAILAFFVLQEELAGLQIIGMGLLILGAYVLEIEGSIVNFFRPLKKIFKTKYIHYIFLALLLYGFSSLVDRYMMLQGVTPETFIVVIHAFIFFNFFILINVFYDGVKGIKHDFKSMGKWILLVSILTVSYRFLQIKAVSMAYVGLVSAIKRTSTLFTTLIGGTLFHEKNLLVKVLGCIIMLWGAVFIIL